MSVCTSVFVTYETRHFLSHYHKRKTLNSSKNNFNVTWLLLLCKITQQKFFPFRSRAHSCPYFSRLGRFSSEYLEQILPKSLFPLIVSYQINTHVAYTIKSRRSVLNLIIFLKFWTLNFLCKRKAYVARNSKASTSNNNNI